MPCACTYRSFAEHTFISQNSFLWCIVVVVYTMATRKSSRRTKHLIKLKDFVAYDFVAESTTPQQMSVAVKRELSQVESLIKDLTTTNVKAEQPTAKRRSDQRSSKPRFSVSLNWTLLAPNSSCCSYSESPRNRVRPRWSRRPQQQHLMVILSQIH